jgi:hypothetical protein
MPGEVWTEAEVRIGAELAKMPKAKGGGDQKSDHRGRNRTSDPATLKELSVSKKRAAQTRTGSRGAGLAHALAGTERHTTTARKPERSAAGF